jgi:hypothetical protein
MAERWDWPNHGWHWRPNGPSEFSWGPGLVPPGKETEPPSERRHLPRGVPACRTHPQPRPQRPSKTSQTQARRPAAWLPRRPGSVVEAHSYRGQPRAGV